VTVTAMLPWERIARAYVAGATLRVLDTLAGDPPEEEGWSAKALAEALEMPLTTASYHLRQLRERGLIVQTGERRASRGGVYQAFYRPAREGADG